MHIIGKVYDMNQENWNKLIAELEAAEQLCARYRLALEAVALELQYKEVDLNYDLTCCEDSISAIVTKTISDAQEPLR